MKYNTSRIRKAFLLTACILSGLIGGTLYVKADAQITTYYVGGVDATDSNTGAGPYATLAKAVEVINASGGTVNTVIVQGDTHEIDVIDIHKNITIVGDTVSGSAIVTYQDINIWEDGSLTLGNSTAVDDQELVFDFNNSWSSVTNYGNFVLDRGVTIQNSMIYGVYNKDTMLMRGGIIQNCGVGINNSMFLTMTGGIIRNNHNSSEGGGVKNSRDFTMKGGMICDNVSDTMGGGVYNWCNFYMSGNAVITRNSANFGGGIYDDNDVYYAKGDYYFGDNLIISGGTISDNTATTGGGIYAGSSIELSGSASVPAGSTGSNDIYLCDRLVVKNNWNYNAEIALTASLLCEGYRILEINPALFAANRTLFQLKDAKYGLTGEGRLTLKDKSNVAVKYVNGTTGDDFSGDGTSAQPYATIEKAVSEIESTADRTGTVVLQSDIELTGTVHIYGDITLHSDGTHTITRDDLFTDCMVEIHGALKLGATDNSGSNQLPSIIFDGESDHGRTANGAILYNQGILDMYSGIIIQNNNLSVTLYSQLAAVTNNNTFHMYGGIIRGNTGSVGGVYSNKTFRMEGSSSIQDNTGIFNSVIGYYGHGGVYTYKYFSMTGGAITNNTGDEAGGVYCELNTGYFDMMGGEISRNRSNNQGGGVNNYGFFRMSGGIITGNQSFTGYSDGIYQASELPLTLLGNAVITPDNAIGIDLFWNNFTDSWSATDIMIGGPLTGTMPVSGDPAVFKVNNSSAVVGTAILRTGSDYHFTWEDSRRFLCDNSQPEEYGTNEQGQLGLLLKKENIAIPHYNIVYNGSARQIMNIVVRYNNVTLTENVDYRVIYSNNINAGNNARVEIRGIGSYAGSYSEYFTIRPAIINIQGIITAKPADRTFTAAQQMTISSLQELLPNHLEVYIDGVTGTMPMTWNLSSGVYHPKGGFYQFTGGMVSDSNHSISGNTQFTVNYTVQPSTPENPEFFQVDVPKGKDKRATVQELGEAFLPTTGYVDLEGYQLNYRIDWEDQALNTTDASAQTTFIGTITYINPPEWVTLPQDLKVSRTIGVYELMDQKLNVNGSEETYRARISRNIEQKSLIVLYDLTRAELLQAEVQLPNSNLLSQLEIPISASDRLLELMRDKAYQDVVISLIIPSELLTDPQFSQAQIKLDPKLLKAAKELGKNIIVKVEDESGSERYSWTFTGKDLANSKRDITGVNLSLSLLQEEQKKELREEQKELIKTESEAESGENMGGLVIIFGQKSALPVEAGVRIYVGDRENFKPGARVYLYHINEKSGLLETLPYSSGYKVDRDGYITIQILQGSKYVILPKKAADSSIISLRDQIQVAPVSKTLTYGSGKNSKGKIEIKLPATLEIVKDLDEKTSSGTIGTANVTYRSSNTKIASVSKDGVITAKGIGTAKIYVKVRLYSGKAKEVIIKINVHPVITKVAERMKR